MKFNKIITSFFSIAAASLLVAACGSNEQTAIDETGKVDSSQGLVFKIEAEEYQTVPTKSATRATGQDTQPQEIDLGNGLVAELTIEPDTLQPAPQTRATISDGHYRIYAINSSDQRLTGPHKSIAGTVSGGVFTPDANKSMLLAHGTYTFVCINDAVTDNGTSLEVKHDAVNAMIGTTTVAITQPRQEISFTMRHMMARIRFQITSYTSTPTNAKFSMATDAGPFGTETFNIKGEKISQAHKAYSFSNIPLAPSTTVQHSPIVKKWKSLTNYIYIPNGFDTGIIQSGGVNGNLYGKTFSISPTSWFLNRTTVQRNHSYIFNFTIKTKDPLYLYQDGTVGYIDGRSTTRQPIGIVIKEKTTTENGMAMALKDIGEKKTVGDLYYDYSIMGDDGTINSMQGYDLTHTTNYYKPGAPYTLPPGETPSFPAYYEAAHYTPGVSVTGTNIGKWFLPSAGQWILAAERFGGLDKTSITEINIMGAWDGTTAATYFTKAGGTLPLDTYAVSGTVSGALPCFVNLSATQIVFFGDPFVILQTGYPRAFVYF